MTLVVSKTGGLVAFVPRLAARCDMSPALVIGAVLQENLLIMNLSTLIPETLKIVEIHPSVVAAKLVPVEAKQMTVQVRYENQPAAGYQAADPTLSRDPKTMRALLAAAAKPAPARQRPRRGFALAALTSD